MSIYNSGQELVIYVFGNGNTSFEDFVRDYGRSLHRATFLAKLKPVSFIVCDYKGVDTLAMEYLKTRTENVSVYHMGKYPRYFPAAFGTKAGPWKSVGGFENDGQRDSAAIEACTHFIAYDFNSSPARKSGTQRNIERCIKLDKGWITV